MSCKCSCSNHYRRLISDLNIQHNVCKKTLFLNHLQFCDELKQLVEEGSHVKIVLERKEEVVASAHRAVTEEEQQFVEKPNPSMWHSLVSICFKLVCARTRCSLNEALIMQCILQRETSSLHLFQTTLALSWFILQKGHKRCISHLSDFIVIPLCVPLKTIYK